MVSQLTFCCAGLDNFCLVHVSLVPVLGVVGEQVRDQITLLYIEISGCAPNF